MPPRDDNLPRNRRPHRLHLRLPVPPPRPRGASPSSLRLASTRASLTRSPLSQFARPAPSTSTPAASPSPAGSPSPSPVPQSEIDKVKKEYEDKQKRKADSASSDSADKDSSSASSSGAKAPATSAFGLLKTGASALSSLTSSAQSQLFPAPVPPTPSATDLARAAARDAKVFVLQRDFFRMRSEAKRREWEKKDAKERGGTWSFPKAPRGGLPGA